MARSAKKTPTKQPTAGRDGNTDKERTTRLVCLVAVIGWMWAGALIANRLHPLENYSVVQPHSPGAILPADLQGPANLIPLAFILLVGALIWWALRQLSKNASPLKEKGEANGETTEAPDEMGIPTAALWLLGCYVICGLELVRVALHQEDQPPAIRYSIWEAILHCLVTGLAAASFARHWKPDTRFDLRHSHALWICWSVALVMAIAWFFESRSYQADLLLGYHDFGHFARRVANTWAGRGWLIETPSLPRFWDHFNPGLTLLAPLWGMWPSADMFFTLQAVCLASGIPLVYGIARRFNAKPLTALLWSAGYLFYPATSQLNVSYTYGWHPITQALPLFLLAAYSLLRGWRWMCLGCVVLACSFHEGVFVVLACVCLALAWIAYRDRSLDNPHPLTRSTKTWQFLCCAAALAVGFVLVFRFSGLAEFQTQRFGHLGQSTLEIVSSPLTRPVTFWGTVFRPRCLVFVALLVLPFAPNSLRRGWPLLAALAPPVGVLVAWTHLPATSMALQYPTTLMPILFLASFSGSLGPDSSDQQESPALWTNGVACAFTGLAVSLSFGSFPWSVPTLTAAVHRTYSDNGEVATEQRAHGSIANQELLQWVDKILSDRPRVLSSGRIAAHLLNAERLEPVDEAMNRWPGITAEAGPTRKPIEVFDWVVLDHWEQFQQGSSVLRHFSQLAQAAGFKLVYAKYGIEIWRKQ